jgi:hypothetical protein
MSATLGETEAKELMERAKRLFPDLFEELCPRCGLSICSAECIAQEQAEIDAYTGPIPRKFV